jgi:hypothetical protein
MQGICNYIPERNHVSRLYSVAAVLYLQFVLHVMLLCPCSMFCTFKLAFFFLVCVWFPIGPPPPPPSFHAFLVCCSGIVWVILKWFRSPLLLLVSFILSHSTCTEFQFKVLYILESSQLLAWITFLSTEIATSINMHYYYFILTISY